MHASLKAGSQMKRRSLTPSELRGRLGVCLGLAVLAAACVETTTEEAAGGLSSSVAQGLTVSSENSTCVTFHRGAQGAVADAHISSHQPAHTAGEAVELYVGQVGKNQRQALLRFDMSSIPPEALVTSATLRVWRNPSSALATPGVHAITSAWQESTVSWNSFRSAFAPQIAARLDLSSRHSGALSTDLTSLVRSWVRSPSVNHGLLLEQASGHSLLASSESPHAARRPSLEVCYFVPESVPQSTSLLVRVLDANGAPLPSAAVSVSNSLQPTDGAGYLFLDGLPTGRFLARVDVPGFAPATVAADLREGLHAGTEVRLLPLGPPLPFDAEQGATLEREGVRVTLPPNGLVYPNGQPVTGSVDLTIVPLDPTQGLATMPGPLEGVTASGGQQVPLESFFMAELSLSQYGVPLQLAPGASAVVEFPLSERAALGLKPGDSIPAWWFDLDAGVWREEGVGLVQASQTNPGQLSWVAELHHFTWWNADAPWDDRSCVKVLVQNGGVPVVNVPVSAVGTSYTGTSLPVYTGADGRACIDIKKGGTADVFVGLPGTPFSNPISVTGSATPSACAGDNTGCVSITLQVSTPVCIPGSFERCLPYAGNGIGICQPSRRTCGVFGLAWSACAPNPPVEAEATDDCQTPFDENCNNVINDGCACSTTAPPKDCYTGPEDTAGVGICEYGTQACGDYDGDGDVELGQCVGQVLPGTETCSTVADDNCDGSTECDDLIEWGRRFGDAQCQEGWGIAANGTNIFVTGWLKGTADFGGGPRSSVSEDDVFVARLTPQGNHAWSQTFSGPGLNVPIDMAVDGSGNVLIAVVFVSTTTIAGQNFAGTGATDTLVVKLSPSGALLWAQQLSGPMHQEARGIATDALGNVLVTGLMTGPLTVGTMTASKYPGYMDSFVLKLNGTNGSPVWVRNHGGTGTTAGLRVAAGPDQHVVAVGGFTANANFGLPPIPRTSAGGYDAFVVKLDKDTGAELWVEVFGNNLNQAAEAVAVNSNNKVVFTGYFYGSMDFGGPTLTSAAPATSDGFLVRLDAMGGHEQSFQWGGTGDEFPSALAMDGAGGVVISGFFDGAGDFGGGPRTADSPVDFFLARYDSTFNHLWSKGFPGASAQRIYRQDLAFDSAGQVLFTGSFQGTVDLGNNLGSLTSEGCTDALVLKLRPIP